MARAAEAGGADVISLINTITRHEDRCEPAEIRAGQQDRRYVRPGSEAGGTAHGVPGAQAVKVPVIGMGGISTAEDALEFILAGATAVSVGTANFANPYATVDVVEGIESYMRMHQIEDINELIGAVR